MSGSQSAAVSQVEAHLAISNQWLIDNASDKNAVMYCEYRDGLDPDHYSTASGKAGIPRGVAFRGTAASDGAAAIIRGYLWDENSAQADDHYLIAGQIHPMRFKRIYAQGTTARHIKVYY